MTLIRTADRGLSAIVSALLVISFSVMLGLAGLQVGLRGLFHTGILWGDVAARQLVLWVGFFGAYLATRENRHFRIDVLTRFLPFRIRLWFNGFSDLFAAVVCYFLLSASLTFVEVGMDPDAIAFLRLPQHVIAMIIPAGFALVMVQFVIRMILSVEAAVRGTVPEEKV